MNSNRFDFKESDVDFFATVFLLDFPPVPNSFEFKI